ENLFGDVQSHDADLHKLPLPVQNLPDFSGMGPYHHYVIVQSFMRADLGRLETEPQSELYTARLCRSNVASKERVGLFSLCVEPGSGIDRAELGVVERIVH